MSNGDMVIERVEEMDIGWSKVKIGNYWGISSEVMDIIWVGYSELGFDMEI